MWDWLVPEPESKELMYEFELGKLDDESEHDFGLGFICYGTSGIMITVNETEIIWIVDETQPTFDLIPLDSLKASFISVYSALYENDSALIDRLDSLLYQKDFIPWIIQPLDPGSLTRGTNTISFTGYGDNLFNEDFMISHIVISDEDTMDVLPKLNYIFSQ